MSEWDPQKRDEEFQHIRKMTTGLAVVSVGATLVLGYGIAWGDQQRVDQADNRESAQSDEGSPAPSPSSSTKAKKPKSKSGGS